MLYKNIFWRMFVSSVLLFLFINCSQSTQTLKVDPGNLMYAYSNDIHINYEKIGYGEKKIVFIHGFGTSLHTWDDVKELFPKKECTLYLIDLKGFGNSSKPEDDKYTIDEQSKIVKQFMQDLNTDSLYLIGHSYGGAVALFTQILLLNDESKTKIRKLILIDCLAYVQEIPTFIEYLRTPVVNQLTFLLPNKFKAEYILNKIFYDKSMINEKLIDRYAKFYTGDEIDYAFIKSAEQININDNEKITDAYKNIPTQCLIIWGKNDLVLKLENGIKLNHDLQNSRLEIIEECGHVPHEEKAKYTFEKIYAFIDS